ncbi:hypothetical protein [Pseudoalteromonas piscicida]|uniref:hypothetical protein n=1 Tax=Pseudoalteromonas piscicida TaxID=43662 RepID=UPI0030AEFD0D
MLIKILVFITLFIAAIFAIREFATFMRYVIYRKEGWLKKLFTSVLLIFGLFVSVNYVINNPETFDFKVIDVHEEREKRAKGEDYVGNPER